MGRSCYMDFVEGKMKQPISILIAEDFTGSPVIFVNPGIAPVDDILRLLTEVMKMINEQNAKTFDVVESVIEENQNEPTTAIQ